MDRIDIIRTMLSNNKFDKYLLLSILDSFGDDISLIPLWLKEGQKILRCRVNNDDFFYRVNDLSYPPISSAKTDRASLEGCPMFYGSIFSKGTEIGAFPRLVSYFETKDINRIVSPKLITHSVWLAEEPIHVFAFPFFQSAYDIACDEISELYEIWNTIKHSFPIASNSFFEYIGEMMAHDKVSCLYEITSLCVQYIINKKGFDGVIYPSVPAKGAGLNICLTPAAVNSKFKLLGAVTEIVRKEATDKIIFENLADAQIINQNDSFNWKVRKECLYYIKMMCPDLCFDENDDVIIAKSYLS